MSQYAEYEALSAVGNAYLEWVEVSARLASAMDAAAAAGAAPPVAVMDADFTAGLLAVRAAIVFARACPPTGPHLDDLPGPAFVQALFQAVTPELPAEVDELVAAWDQWLPLVAQWTPASAEQPPPRPTSTSVTHVLEVVDAWFDAGRDAEDERVIQLLTAAGGTNVGTSYATTSDGRLVTTTHITGLPVKPADDPAGPVARWWRRIRRHQGAS
ncbi:hypothetical protein QRB38_20205 [Mycobacterium avium subsp. hominissuis]|uniref:hypothetical protein n=1 Tax=Mycobacterium avium TaxID=1764 RepID=UPI002666FBF8|nr:hypothetical protein [Mycobacterium avium]MDO2396101.1 hypothetical protein [Mycobacterium avium subsp. hominissuis]